MEKTSTLRIEVTDRGAVVTGPSAMMARVLPLRDMNYIEFDGQIRTEVYDPVPHLGRMVANRIIHRVRRRVPCSS